MRSAEVYEDITLLITSKGLKNMVLNTELVSDKGKTTEKFVMYEVSKLEIYALNLYDAPRNTFLIQVEEVPGS